MSKVKRQHFVPQSYLRRWACKDNDKQIKVFDKEQKKSFSSSINGVASSNYFYDIPVDLLIHQDRIYENAKNEGISKEDIDLLMNKQFIEKTLSSIECKAHNIIEKIIKKLDNISAFPDQYINSYLIFEDEDKRILGYFIALQYLRTEDIRFVIEEISQKLYKELAWSIMQCPEKETDDNLVTQISEEPIFDLTRAIQDGSWTRESFDVIVEPIYTKLQHIGIIFDIAKEIELCLLNHKWIIERNFTDLPYYTSDNPVSKKANLNHLINSDGFQSKGIEIHFPLSPKYSLTIYEHSYLKEIRPDLLTKHIIDAKRSNVIYCNDIQVQNATNQLFCQIGNFDLALKRVLATPSIAKRKRERIQISKFG